MREISRVAQHRLQVTHHGNDDACLAIALVAVLNLHKLIHHLVDMTAVLGQIEFTARVIVIVFHKIMCGYHIFALGRNIIRGF